MRRVRPNWHPSGWKIVGRTGVIEYTLSLPVNPRAYIRRERPVSGEPWRYRIAGGPMRGRYKTATAAMIACEAEVRSSMLASFNMLRS